MNGRLAYLDTSAFVKLIVGEAEAPALRHYLDGWPFWASARLLRTEAVRALRRYDRSYMAPARGLLRGMHLVSLDDPLLDRAGELDPPHVRSLDAVHIAAALSLGPELGVLLTYDDRMGDAAREEGLRVASPG